MEQPICTGRGEKFAKADQLVDESLERSIFHNESLTGSIVELGSFISSKGCKQRPISKSAAPYIFIFDFCSFSTKNKYQFLFTGFLLGILAIFCPLELHYTWLREAKLRVKN